MTDDDRTALAKSLPVPAERNFLADRQYSLKEFLLNEIQLLDPPQPTPSPIRRHRRGWAIGTGIALAACAAVLAGTTLHSAAPSRQQSTTAGAVATGASIHAGQHIQLADFTLDTTPSGAKTLTIDNRKLFNASALRSALAAAGVPATVTDGSYCTVPGGVQAANKIALPPPATIDGAFKYNLAAIPPGDQLSFGVLHLPAPSGAGSSTTTGGTDSPIVSVVPQNAHLTCSSTLPPPTTPTSMSTPGPGPGH